MSRVFVSYRREDSSGHAGRLQEHLGVELGKKSVFVDVGSIDPGINFEEAIEKAIVGSKVVIAVIGTDWLNAQDEQGRRRLDNPDDYVRLELERAFQRNVKVIPVLVRGATMPRAEDLPESLRKLSAIQSLEIRDTRWEADLETVLREVGGPPLIRKIRRNKRNALFVLLFPIIIPFVYYLTQAPVDDAERFLTSLAQGNMQDAYGATAFTFQQQIDEETFVREIRRLGLQDNASASWSSRNISNGMATLSGKITTKQRGVIPLKIILIKEAGAWKVLALEVPDASFGVTNKTRIGPDD